METVKTIRPSFIQTYLDMAEVLARRSSCPRLNVGAIIADEDNKVLSVGYNGAPSGMPHCIDVGCELVDGHCSTAVHAEINAVLNSYTGLIGSTLYLYGSMPCYRCAQALISVGIEKIYIKNQNPNWELTTDQKRGKMMLGQAGIRIEERDELT